MPGFTNKSHIPMKMRIQAMDLYETCARQLQLETDWKSMQKQKKRRPYEKHELEAEALKEKLPEAFSPAQLKEPRYGGR